MSILADFNQTEIALEVKKMTSSLNIRPLRLSTQNLKNGLFYDVSPQITVKTEPILLQTNFDGVFYESETEHHQSDQIP